jgi:hypothetical protein
MKHAYLAQKIVPFAIYPEVGKKLFAQFVVLLSMLTLMTLVAHVLKIVSTVSDQQSTSANSSVLVLIIFIARIQSMLVKLLNVGLVIRMVGVPVAEIDIMFQKVLSINLRCIPIIVIANHAIFHIVRNVKSQVIKLKIRNL